MGWFRKSDDSAGADDGLYRGDAPVFMPGAGDQEPSAYVRPAIHEPAPEVRPEWPSGPASATQWTTPPGPASPGSAITVTRRRGPGAGCGLITVVVIALILVGLGIGGWSLFRTFSSTFPVIRDVPDTQIGGVDVPVTVDYRDAQLRITVGGAQAQPGGGWDDDNGEPTLVVATTIERVDDGSASVHVPFIDWAFAPAGGGPAVDVDIISGFEPDLTSVILNAGETVSGYLAYGTAATGGQMTLAGDRFQDPPLAAWPLTATVPQPITAGLGEPTRPQIGRPAFTVTLDSTAWTDQAGAGAWKPPAGGSFLIADLTLTSTGGRSSDWVEDSSFVFVPAGRDAVQVAPPDVVSSAQSYATVGAGESAPLRAVFDVAAGPGNLEMRDAAGRTMVSWPIA